MRGNIFGKIVLFLLILIAMPIFLPGSFAVTINPLEYSISNPEFNKEYKVVITVINTEPSLISITPIINSNSEYLSKYAKLDSVEPFTLGPHEKRNINLFLNIPETISPEKHTLLIDFYSKNALIGKFKLFFEVPGNRIEELELKELKVDSKSTEEPVYFTFTLENTGNVISRPIPNVAISKDNQVIDRLGEESSLIMVMPHETYNFSLMYDPIKLKEGGEFSVEAKFIYGSNVTSTLKKQFEIKANRKKTESGNEIKEIAVGEKVSVDVLLKNPSDKISFYKIIYNVEGASINQILDGEMREKSKEVPVVIDTSSLEVGDYKINFEVQTGINLENTELKTIDLVVKEKRSYLVFFLSGLTIIILLGYFFRHYITVFMHNITKLFGRITARRLKPVAVNATVAQTPAPYVATNSPLGFLVGTRKNLAAETDINDLSRSHSEVLQDTIFKLNKDYGSIETEMKRLSAEIGKFVDESNKWLDKHYGIGRYGFK